MGTYAHAIPMKKVKEPGKPGENPLAELINSKSPEDQVAREAPLSAIVNQREALPLEEPQRQIESPLAALVKRRTLARSSAIPARGPNPMEKLVNRRG